MTEKKSAAEKKVDKDPEGAAEAANKQVQETVDVETEQGFRGVEVDQTPNEAYTVTGDHSSTPEAQADPVVARKAASNPDQG